VDSTKIRRKSTGQKIQWKKTCGKTTTEMVRQYQEGLIVAVDYKGIKETSNGREIWRRLSEEGTGPDAGCCAPEEEKKRTYVSHKIIHFIVTDICTKPIIFCKSISLEGSLHREGQ